MVRGRPRCVVCLKLEVRDVPRLKRACKPLDPLEPLEALVKAWRWRWSPIRSARRWLGSAVVAPRQLEPKSLIALRAAHMLLGLFTPGPLLSTLEAQRR